MNETQDILHSLTEEKRETRLRALALRDAIPADERANRSLALCNQLARELLPQLAPGSIIAVYSAMRSEVDVAPFCAHAAKEGYRVAYPCLIRSEHSPSGNGRQMIFYLLDDACPRPDFLAHPARAYDQDDPSLASCTLVEPASIDAVVVPMVAFDESNNRLGYGGGNYDCLLSAVPSSTVIAGVAFQEQLLEEIPLEPHDLPLPRIVVA